ncbi:hypothetical protein M407DRAFT_195197 [Tulasnella calospora MUT 4182]|uniref:Phytoene synthase n=1 Tax=Tulasnella calospora MUT 4182 TaxID=1051891 RepID=A0A0C3L029_9AGAM|nr:hypothetical protein M407DRAFT_195197 [Tulasnella calospora MUT 4182]
MLIRSAHQRLAWRPPLLSLRPAKQWQRKNHSQTADSQDSNAYCRDLVRKHDYDSFLTSYFYPRRTHDAYFALRAFNVELALVREAVSQPMIGKMRMQFWRDAVKSIQQDKPPHHPIAVALHRASKEFKLPAYHLNRIIDARDQDLVAPTHPTVDSVATYAESTSSTMLYLVLSMLNLSSSDTLAHAASHIGVASSFATLLRALPFHASQRRMVIPVDLTSKNGVREEEVYRSGGHAEGISDAVFDFATVANDHLLTARQLFKESGEKVPAEAMPVFLSAVPVASFLEQLEKVNFDAFDPSLQKRDWKLPFRIWRASSSRSF